MESMTLQAAVMVQRTMPRSHALTVLTGISGLSLGGTLIEVEAELERRGKKKANDEEINKNEEGKRKEKIGNREKKKRK